MTKQFVTDYIDKKLKENEDYIRYTYYELKVTHNLKEDEIQTFLEINKNYFENNGYKVFFTGARFEYDNCKKIVESNELMIAIKEKIGEQEHGKRTKKSIFANR